MTTTHETDYAAIWRALYEWLQIYAGLPENSVRRLNQVAGRPDLPYATMQVIADVGGGVEGEEQNYNITTETLDTVTYGPRRLTLQITVYTAVEQDETDQNAMSRLAGAINALRVPSVKQLFKVNGVAFLQQLSSVQEADQQLGQRWERRANVDLEFSYTAYTTVIADSEGAPLVSMDPITEADGTLTVQES